MKLGKQTASLVNHLQSRAVIGQPAPVVGMGATLLSWTDRHAATIVAVGKVGSAVLLTVQEDHAKVVKGSTHNGSAEYEYSRNIQGHLSYFKQAKNGKWDAVTLNQETKRWNKTGGYGLSIGGRQEYRDPHF